MPFCSINSDRNTSPHSITLGQQTDHEGNNPVQKAQYYGKESSTIAFVKTTSSKIATTDAIAHVIAKKIAGAKVRVPTVFLAKPDTIVSLNICQGAEKLEAGTDYSFDTKNSIQLINAGFGAAEALRFALADEDGAGNTQLIKAKDGFAIVAFDFEYANNRKVKESDESAQQFLALEAISADLIAQIPAIVSKEEDTPFLPHEGLEDFSASVEMMGKDHEAVKNYYADYLSTLRNFCELMSQPNLREEILASLQLTQDDLALLPEFDNIIASFKARASAIQKAVFPDLAPAVALSQAADSVFSDRHKKRRASLPPSMRPNTPITDDENPAPRPSPSPPQRERKQPRKPGSDDNLPKVTAFTFGAYQSK